MDVKRAARTGRVICELNEELFKLIELDEFPTKYCYARAMTLHNSNPKKYKLVIGSLGYIQSDGSIFWEFG